VDKKKQCVFLQSEVIHLPETTPTSVGLEAEFSKVHIVFRQFLLKLIRRCRIRLSLYLYY